MNQKYRQRGYMESGREDRPRRRPPSRPLSPEERAHKKGLRHALDPKANEVLRCHVCGRNVQNLGAVVPDTTCPHCNAPLHCCRTCRHFDSSARWECRAQITEHVTDKGSANRCPEYEPRLVLDATGKRSQERSPRSNDPKAMFDDLFKR